VPDVWAQSKQYPKFQFHGWLTDKSRDVFMRESASC
jgi:hypothetical protein